MCLFDWHWPGKCRTRCESASEQCRLPPKNRNKIPSRRSFTLFVLVSRTLPFKNHQNNIYIYLFCVYLYLYIWKKRSKKAFFTALLLTITSVSLFVFYLYVRFYINSHLIGNWFWIVLFTLFHSPTAFFCLMFKHQHQAQIAFFFPNNRHILDEK